MESDNKKSSRNIITIIIIILVAAISFVLGYFLNNSNDEINILSAPEVLQLREEYPFQQYYPDSINNTISYLPPSYTNEIERPEGFVHVEITSDVEEYHERLGDNNYSSRITSYKAKIIDDANGNFKNNEEIELVTAEDYDYLVPVLNLGNQYILPVSSFITDEYPNRYMFNQELSFYVTDSNHVLSLYDVEDFTIFDGNTVSQVFKKFAADTKNS